MHIGTLLGTLGLIAVCSTALADPPTPTPPPTTPPQIENSQERICQDRIATGSRLAYARDCHTRAEWEVIRRASRDYINGIEKRALNSNNLPGVPGH